VRLQYRLTLAVALSGLPVTTSVFAAETDSAGRLAAGTGAADTPPMPAGTADRRLAFDRPITVRYAGTSLEQVLADLSAKAGVPVEADWPNLTDAGIDRATSVHACLRGLPARRVLELVLTQVSTPTAQLKWVSVGGRVRVCPAEHYDAPPVERRYAVPGLLLTVDGVSREQSQDDLLRIIQETVTPDAWRETGGTRGTIGFDDRGRLVVGADPPAHAELVALLNDLACPVVAPALPPAAATTARRADALWRLTRPLLPQADSLTLDELTDRIANRTGVNVFLDRPALTAVGVSSPNDIRLTVGVGPAGPALRDAIALASGDASPLAAAVTDDGVLVVSTREVLNAHVVTGVYRLPATVASAADREMFAQRLLATVDPDSWRDNGGQYGSLRFYGSLAVVRQSPRDHRAVADWIASYKASSPKP
jgi:hypothetical protein